MNRRLLACMLALLVFGPGAIARSDESRELVALRPSGWGGYGGPHFRISSLNGQVVMFGGGPIMLLSPGPWGLGLTACQLEGDADGLEVLYGGLRGELDLASFVPLRRWGGSLLEISAAATLGGGAAWLEGFGALPEEPAQAAVLVAEPELTLALRLLPSVRLALAGGYRLAVPLADLPGVTMRELSGPVGAVSLQYGLFPERPGLFEAEARRNPGSGPAPAAPAAAPAAPAAAAARGGPSRVTLSGAWSFKPGMAAGQFILLDGGGTRLVFNRRLYVGAGGYRSHPGPRWAGEGLFLMYGGLWAEYAFAPEAPLNVSLGGLLGAGAAGLLPDGATEFSAATGMLVLDPEAYLNLSITEFMRLSVGVSYRLSIPFGELPGLSMWDLGGPAAVLQLRFLGY